MITTRLLTTKSQALKSTVAQRDAESCPHQGKTRQKLVLESSPRSLIERQPHLIGKKNTLQRRERRNHAGNHQMPDSKRAKAFPKE